MEYRAAPEDLRRFILYAVLVRASKARNRLCPCHMVYHVEVRWYEYSILGHTLRCRDSRITLNSRGRVYAQCRGYCPLFRLSRSSILPARTERSLGMGA